MYEIPRARREEIVYKYSIDLLCRYNMKDHDRANYGLELGTSMRMRGLLVRIKGVC